MVETGFPFKRIVEVTRYPPPVTVRVVDSDPVVTGFGVTLVIVGVAAGPTVNVWVPLLPPPGAGDATVTATAPAAIRLASTVARTSVAL